MVLNCRSIKNKSGDFLASVEYFSPDCVLGTESWLNANIHNSEIFPPNYTVYRKDRDTTGGGVFIALKSQYTCSEIPCVLPNCETVWAKIDLKNSRTLHVGCFYRPPNSGTDPIDSLRNFLSDLPGKPADKHLILGGDFNLPGIDWSDKHVTPNNPHPNLSRSFLDLVDDMSLEQLVEDPTRGSNILDLYLTNRPTFVKKVSVVPGISDHDAVIVDTCLRPSINKKVRRKIFKYTDENLDAVKQDLLSYSVQFLDSLPDSRSVEENWNHFKSHLNKIIEKHVPSKFTSSRYSLPWLDSSLRRLIKRKNRLYRKIKKSSDEGMQAKFKNVKHECQKQIRNAHKIFVKSILEKGLQENNNKAFWKYIKSKKQDNFGIQPLRLDGRLFSDDVTKSEILSTQFQSVFSTNNCKPKLLPLLKYPRIAVLEISQNGITKLLKEINVTSASGPDDISNRVLQHCASELSPVLTYIFRQSFKSATLPSDWLKANVTPIFKKGDRHAAENYRPVSLTSVCCKIMEHIVCKHLRNHLDRHNILSSTQHGFRKRHSCETQLLVTVDNILKHYDRKVQVDLVVLDFAKAFDKVCHSLLIHKLEELGVTGLSLKWIASFLANRTQQVVVNGTSSRPVSVSSGVPQGTVLGPLLFLCYINDLPECVKSQVRLFADDALLYRPIKDASDVAILQQDLLSLENWAKTWLMEFNPKKCSVLHITRSRAPVLNQYNFCNQHLETQTESPYLGVLLSNDLKWSTHIDTVCNKANSTLGFIRRNLFECPKELKDLAYKSLVRSKLEYACSVWNPHLVKDISRLEMTQRRAARWVCNDYSRESSVTSMLQSLGWLTLEQRREISSLSMLFKIVKGEVAINASDFLDKPARATRAKHGHKFNTIRANTNEYKFSFFVRNIPAWNGLDCEVVSCSKSGQFKSKLTSTFQ
jgi:hypothetical protein